MELNAVYERPLADRIVQIINGNDASLGASKRYICGCLLHSIAAF